MVSPLELSSVDLPGEFAECESFELLESEYVLAQGGWKRVKRLDETIALQDAIAKLEQAGLDVKTVDDPVTGKKRFWVSC